MLEKRKTRVLSTIPSTCVFTTKFLEHVLQPVTKESRCGVCLPLHPPASAQNSLLTGLTSRGGGGSHPQGSPSESPSPPLFYPFMHLPVSLLKSIPREREILGSLCPAAEAGFTHTNETLALPGAPVSCSAAGAPALRGSSL